MKSKKWIFGSFILLIFSAITHIFIINFLYKKPQTWIFNAQTKKEKIAQNMSSPKILITGGSNVIYGDSKRQREWMFVYVFSDYRASNLDKYYVGCRN